MNYKIVIEFSLDCSKDGSMIRSIAYAMIISVLCIGADAEAQNREEQPGQTKAEFQIKHLRTIQDGVDDRLLCVAPSGEEIVLEGTESGSAKPSWLCVTERRQHDKAHKSRLFTNLMLASLISAHANKFSCIFHVYDRISGLDKNGAGGWVEIIYLDKCDNGA